MSIQRSWLVTLALALGGSVLTGTVVAQEPQVRAQPRPKVTKDAPVAATPADLQLKGRVDHLEEQLADMQVVVGTLESLGRGGSATALRGAQAPIGSGVDQARIDSLETQIRALTAQLEQLSAQVRQLAGNRRTEGAPFAPMPAPGAIATAPGGFGSTTVSPDGRPDPIGRILGAEAPQPVSASSALPPSASSAGNPRDLYETAYGYLLQQDYGAAEASFDEFLRRHPNDRLAADAQYWLGEALYVQRRYKPAGQAFLAVIEKHKTSAKVPNSLLKLAQSLEQLGQKDCGIFAELDSRHPNAPADVRVKARALKQRQGC